MDGLLLWKNHPEVGLEELSVLGHAVYVAFLASASLKSDLQKSAV